MNLIQGLLKIRLGLEKGNLQEIADGYEMLSGEKINLQNELQRIAYPTVEKTISKESISMPIERSPGEKIPGKRGRKPTKKVVLSEDTIDNVRKAVQESNLMGRDKKPNKFVDDGTLFQEDKKIDALLHTNPPVERRPPVQMLNIKCESCGKQYEVNPAYFEPEMRKLCNKCARRG